MSARDMLPELIRDSWQARIIEQTQGRKTMDGAIIIAALGYNRAEKFPRVGDKARITSAGALIIEFYRSKLEGYRLSLGQVQPFVDNMRKHADAAGIQGPEREEMFEKLRQWIAKDDRAQSGIVNPVRSIVA